MEILAACHVHSDWSYDGKWTLEQIAEEFASRGYRAVLVTEHDRGFTEARRKEHREACRKAGNERILIIPGIEYSDPGNSIHLLVWGDVPFIGEGIEVGRILSAVSASGGVVVYANPSRRDAWKLFQPEWAGQLHGIELWNRKTDGWTPSRDALKLIETTGATPFVGMDFHNHKQLFPLATILEMDGSVTEAAILHLLKSRQGRSFAFGRPAIEFTRGMRGWITCSGEYARRRTAKFYKSLVRSQRKAGAPTQ